VILFLDEIYHKKGCIYEDIRKNSDSKKKFKRCKICQKYMCDHCSKSRICYSCFSNLPKNKKMLYYILYFLGFFFSILFFMGIVGLSMFINDFFHGISFPPYITFWILLIIFIWIFIGIIIRLNNRILLKKP